MGKTGLRTRMNHQAKDPKVTTSILTEAPTARLLLPADAPVEQWHATRAAGIGGSDVAAILGLDKNRGPRHVFEDKHGRPTFKGNEAAEIGTEIEEFIARMFSKRSGVPIAMPPGTLVHAEHEWARVNVDRFTCDADGAVTGLLECKNRSAYQLDDWEDGVPDAPALQAHWGMAVGGWDEGYVAALVGGNRLIFHRLKRDEEMVAYLLDFCGKWFQRHIVEGFEPPADGLETTTELLSKLWSVKPEAVAEVEVSKAKELRAKALDLKAQVKALGEELRTVENEMRLMTGKNEVAKADGKAAWSWKANGTFASKRFTKGEPELAAKYTHMVPALDLDRLKEEHPEKYDAYRARVLRIPAKGI